MVDFAQTPNWFAQLQERIGDMAAVPAKLGNELWAKAGEGLQAIMDGIVDRVGELGGAAIMAGIAKGGGAAMGIVGGGIKAVSAPFNEKFVSASASLGASSSNDHGLGNARVLKVDPVGVSQHGDVIGSLSPPRIGAGQNIGQGYTRTA